ncbi:MAG: PilZ domain-containing protein [Pseudomonadota bacterium]
MTRPITTFQTFEGRRRYYRKSARVVVRYCLSGREYVGQITNLSLGGACIKVSRPLQPGEVIELHFTLFSNRSEPLTITGQVVSVRPIPPGIWAVGIKFHQLEWAVEKDLGFFMLN